MKILSVKPTTSELSRVGRRVNGNGHAIQPGTAFLVVLDGELERCARVSTRRGTWTVLEQPKPDRLVLLPTHGGLVVGDEVRMGAVAPQAAVLDLPVMRKVAEAEVRAERTPVAVREAPVKAKPKTSRKSTGLFDKLTKGKQ